MQCVVVDAKNKFACNFKVVPSIDKYFVSESAIVIENKNALLRIIEVNKSILVKNVSYFRCAIKKLTEIGCFQQCFSLVIYFFQLAITLIVNPYVVVVRLADGVDLENILFAQVDNVAD